ncbi:MAG: ATP synthase F0 subunit B [Acidobacteria bacterium]|nr:ATP synthase F0 subunit B [Acidobacteriota bacterium]
MEALLSKLGEMVVGALPTVVLVFLLYFFLRWGFFRPLERVLAEREALTTGARQAAEQLLVEAEAKTREYEERLRHARAEIYREQESLRRQALEGRMRILRATREQANQMIREAKTQLLRDVEAARGDLERESQRLAEEIARTMLVPAGGARGGRA